MKAYTPEQLASIKVEIERLHAQFNRDAYEEALAKIKRLESDKKLLAASIDILTLNAIGFEKTIEELHKKVERLNEQIILGKAIVPDAEPIE